NHALTLGGDFRNQLRQGGRKDNGFMTEIKVVGATGVCSSQVSQGICPNQSSRHQWNFQSWQLANSIRHGRQGRIAASLQRLGNNVTLPASSKATIYDQALIANTKSFQFPPRAFGLGQRGAFRPRHQVNGGSPAVAQGAYRVVVEFVLRLQS